MNNKIFFNALFVILLLSVFNSVKAQNGWEIITSGSSQELNSIYFYDYQTGYTCGNSGTVLISADSGITWNTLSTPTSVKLNDIFAFNEQNAIAVGESGTIIRTNDGGLNWDLITSGVTDELLSVSFVDSFGICGARSQTILFSTNRGHSWSIAQSGWIGGGFWGAIMLSPEIGFIAGENSIFQPLLGMTTDSGQNWSFSAFYLNNNEGRATGVEFTDIFIGYASSRVWDGRGAISKTTDSGNTWVTSFFSNPLWGIDFPISNASLVGYSVGDSGVILKTHDAGTNWLTQQSGTTVRLNKVYFIDLDFGFAVGESGIILRTTTGGEPVTQVDDDNSTVFNIKIYQNYPNPFNPSTKIKFSIPSVGTSLMKFVQLKVYDVLGNEVATLVNEKLPAGEYEVEFNSHSSSVSSFRLVRNLMSGVYFYQLKAGEFVSTKKMILLR